MCYLRDYAFHWWRPYGPHLVLRFIEFIILLILFIVAICTVVFFHLNPTFIAILVLVIVSGLLLCFIDLLVRCFNWAISWMAWFCIAILVSLGLFLLAGIGIHQSIKCAPHAKCGWLTACLIIAILAAIIFILELFTMIYWLVNKKGCILIDDCKKCTIEKTEPTPFSWFGNKAPCANSEGIPVCGKCYIPPCADEFGKTPCGVCDKLVPPEIPRPHSADAVQIKRSECVTKTSRPASEALICKCRPTESVTVSRANVNDAEAQPSKSFITKLICYCDEPEPVYQQTVQFKSRETQNMETQVDTPILPPRSSVMSRLICHCSEPETVPVRICETPMVMKQSEQRQKLTCYCGSKTAYAGSYGGTFPCEKYGAPLPPSPTARTEQVVMTRTVSVRTKSTSKTECVCEDPLPSPKAKCEGYEKCAAAKIVAEQKKAIEERRSFRGWQDKCTCMPQTKVCPKSPCICDETNIIWPTVCPESNRKRGGSSIPTSAQSSLESNVESPSFEIRLPGAADTSPQRDRKSLD